MQGNGRDVKSAVLLIGAALATVVVMALHPTGHGMADPTTGPRLVMLNAVVHSLAIAATPVLFLALLGVARYLGQSDLTTAALVAFGFGGAAVMGAAVASGFVAPGVITGIVAKDGSTVPHAFLFYTTLWNQAFAKVHTVAASAGIVLFSTAILRTKRMPAPIAWYGILIGVAIPLLLMSGTLTLNVHGFGVVTASQALWFAAVAAALFRAPADRSSK